MFPFRGLETNLVEYPAFPRVACSKKTKSITSKVLHLHAGNFRSNVTHMQDTPSVNRMQYEEEKLMRMALYLNMEQKKKISPLLFSFLILLFTSCMKNDPRRQASLLTGLSIPAEAVIDTLKNVGQANGDYEFKASFTIPKKDLPNLESEAKQLNYMPVTPEDSALLPQYMQGYIRQKEEWLYLHTQTKNADNYKFVLLNTSSGQLLIYAVQI